MSEYYNPRKTRNLFDVNSSEPFKLSRTKIDLFLNCPFCFYSDAKLGISRPGGFPFSLNNAVDLLLKKEFDIHRANQTKHPFLKEYGIDVVPFKHKDIDLWRNARQGGITYLHKPTNFLVCGGIDDLWLNPEGKIHVVDYKATAKEGEVNLDADWQIGYKRQVEIYQWLFRKNGFKVSDIAYFVYCNGNIDKKAFDKKIEFDVKILPYKGNDSWIEGELLKIHDCLSSNLPPKISSDCDFCRYREEINKEFNS